MDEVLYNVMNWPEVETIVYAEHDNPHHILGAHQIKEGILIQCFFPTATAVWVKDEKNQRYPMERTDDAGFFSIIIPQMRLFNYTYVLVDKRQDEWEVFDPYNFEPVITATDIIRFQKGIHYSIFDVLGAHVMEVDGIEGVLFAVWAPNAVRVSVVGDFNLWDGRRHPMRRLKDSGIFELFIPQITQGELYKYEIKLKGDINVLKSDPYAFGAEFRPANASIVYNLDQYQWNDELWMFQRKRLDTINKPMLIYEVHLGSFCKPKNGDFYNYRDIAPKLCDYVKKMGYTHIELLPIMEHPLDASWGYQVTGYYAVTSRYGTPEDFMYFMDYMHNENIGVILDWVPAHFPRDSYGLANFDGTCLYEHWDSKKSYHPHWGTLIFDYGKPEVSNFLIGNILFWIEKYHIDGIRMDAVASMLYLDYGRKDGEWVPNIYGGNENLEAAQLLKHLNTIVHRRGDGVFTIAEESTAWSGVTDVVERNGLGFDYKWNMGWMNDFTNYMKCDPLFRSGKHNDLTFSMLYHYSERFVLVLSHDEVVHGKGSMIQKMPGEYDEKFNNLRVAYGFMIGHPGKKLLFMGQEFAQFREWNEAQSLDWDIIAYEKHNKLQRYVMALNQFYKNHPACYELDYDLEGFEWINCNDSSKSVVSFIRRSKRNDQLIFVCNFTPVLYDHFQVGVPAEGRYKEVFNSDKEIYGGTNYRNRKRIVAKQEEFDGRDYSIHIVLPPFGMVVFQLQEKPKKQRICERQ